MSSEMPGLDLGTLFEQQANYYAELADLHRATMRQIPPVLGWTVRLEKNRRDVFRTLALEYRRAAAMEREVRRAMAGGAL